MMFKDLDNAYDLKFILGLITEYIKTKGIETSVIQLSNLIIPLAPLLTEVLGEGAKEILPMVLDMYGLAKE